MLQERLGLLAIAVLAAVLLFANLGNRYLWQDEAQTALVSRTILAAGIPLGTDGRNSFSQEQGAELGAGGVWKWHTWLSFYLVAGSFAVLGADTLPARLPFALCGLATVILTGVAARELWGRGPAVLAAPLLLTLSVPFLLASRQARYYALATLLSLAGLHLYARLDRGGRSGPWLLFASTLLLFHTHYVYAATLLATLLLHAAWLERQRLRPVLGVSAAVSVLAIPWVSWLASVQLTPEKARSFLDLGDTLPHAGEYLSLLFGTLFAHGAFLLIPLLLLVRRRWRREPLLRVSPATRSGVALLALYCATTILLLALLSPLFYLRYLFPLLPPLHLLTGLWVGSLWRAWPLAAAAVVAAFAVTGSLRDFAHEITHDYDGPIEGIVGFLRNHAEPDDVVAIGYGDLPLKFYTELRVVGGLTGEDLAPVAEADWIVPRRHLMTAESAVVAERLRTELDRGRFESHVIPYPDIAFENREDPQLHHFRTARGRPRVVIWRRTDARPGLR